MLMFCCLKSENITIFFLFCSVTLQKEVRFVSKKSRSKGHIFWEVFYVFQGKIQGEKSMGKFKVT